MKSKLFLFVLVVLVLLPTNLVNAETDELVGYEYTPKKANEIDSLFASIPTKFSQYDK